MSTSRLSLIRGKDPAPNDSSGVGDIASDDIIKKGYMKKLKPARPLQTHKKKFFVIRGGNYPYGRLEYYESEKKFKLGEVPKRCIILNECFNISKKADSKHRHLIALYTRRDCFQIVCEGEDEQSEWYETMQRMTKEEGEATHFEHMWQVTVKAKGLANGKALSSGQYWMCLTNKTLSLIRKGQSKPDITYQLEGVRRCAHRDCFFYLEVGRQTQTGEGEIWMEVEDQVIAQNIHETVLNAMSEKKEDKDIRVLHPKSFRIRSPSNDMHSDNQSQDHRDKRSNTVTGVSPSMGRFQHRHIQSYLSSSHSPGNLSPLSISMKADSRPRAGSMESTGSRSHGTNSDSISETEIDPSPTNRTGHLTPDSSENYLSMASNYQTRRDILITDSPHVSMDEEEVKDPYMAMEISQLQSIQDLEDSLEVSSQPASNCISHNSSPSQSLSSSVQDQDLYLDMTPISHSLPTVEEKLDAGYLMMSPQSRALMKPNSVTVKQDQIKPDKVQSFLSDEFRIRAYSVDSKPAKKATSDKEVLPFDLGVGLEGNNTKSCSAPHLDHSSSQSRPTSITKDECDLFMEMDFMKNMEGIRPRTSSFHEHGRKRTGSAGKRSSAASRAVKKARDGMRPRTATIGQDTLFRQRTSSFGPGEMRPRAASYSNSKVRRHQPSNESSCNSSMESLRRHGVANISMSSHDSLQSSSEYLDMHSQASARSHSNQSQMHGRPCNDYIGMKSGSNKYSKHYPSPLSLSPSDKSPSHIASTPFHIPRTSYRKISTQSLPACTLESPGEYIEVEYKGNDDTVIGSTSHQEETLTLFNHPWVAHYDQASSNPVPMPSSPNRKLSKEESSYMNLDFYSSTKSMPFSKSPPESKVPISTKSPPLRPRLPSKSKPSKPSSASIQLKSGPSKTSSDKSSPSESEKKHQIMLNMSPSNSHMGIMDINYVQTPSSASNQDANAAVPLPIEKIVKTPTSPSSALDLTSPPLLPSSPPSFRLNAAGHPMTGLRPVRAELAMPSEKQHSENESVVPKPTSTRCSNDSQISHSGQIVSSVATSNDGSITSRGSTGSLPAMEHKNVERMKRRSLQENNDSAPELNYASLDLHSSCEDSVSSLGQKSPRHLSGDSSTYAEIDFEKTEAVRRGEPISKKAKSETEAVSVKTTPAPFIL